MTTSPDNRLIVAARGSTIRLIDVSTGSMRDGRYYHTATVLSNGKVLVAGGSTYSASLASADVYDPAAGTWSSAGNMTMPRDQHTAVLLPNGKVLITGGTNVLAVLKSAELYTPAP